MQATKPQSDDDLAAALTRHLQSLRYVCQPYTWPAGTRFPAHSHSVDKIDAVDSRAV